LRELGQELGVHAGDIEVMIAALGGRVDDELTPSQASARIYSTCSTRRSASGGSAVFGRGAQRGRLVAPSAPSSADPCERIAAYAGRWIYLVDVDRTGCGMTGIKLRWSWLL
jgi:hypothetical protein